MNESFSLSARRPARVGLAAALVLLSTCFAFGPAAHAEQADKDKPINIDASNMTYDDLKQVDIFTGTSGHPVVATKGTILIRADRVEVHQDPQGYQYATGTMAPGSKDLAYFHQKREGVDEYVEGTAERIDYDGKKDLTTLTTNATVRRLQGLTTMIDQVHGSVVTYDGQNDFYTARAGNDVAGPGNQSGRVHAILSPRNGAPAPLNGGPAKLTPAPAIQGNGPQ